MTRDASLDGVERSGGLGAAPPRHAKAFAAIGLTIESAIRAYVDEVKTGSFPTAAQSTDMDEDDLRRALTDDVMCRAPA